MVLEGYTKQEIVNATGYKLATIDKKIREIYKTREL